MPNSTPLKTDLYFGGEMAAVQHGRALRGAEPGRRES